MNECYFVVYDLNDNLICYIETKKELSFFTGLRLKDINYKFKNKNWVLFKRNKQLLKIYKFGGV